MLLMRAEACDYLVYSSQTLDSCIWVAEPTPAVIELMMMMMMMILCLFAGKEQEVPDCQEMYWQIAGEFDLSGLGARGMVANVSFHFF